MPAEVYPKIYIGSVHAAFNQEVLVDRGITHILNASRLPSTFPKSFTYLAIDIRDKDEANILACIPASNIFIEAGMDSGGGLVHCYGGRSRSAALVTAFLMSSLNWSYEESLACIQSSRPVACINPGFEAQLKAYHHASCDVYIAQQILLQGRVRALQSYRAIKGSTEDELAVKASERRKFGSLHVCSVSRTPGGVSERSQSGGKRSGGHAKDITGSEVEHMEEENMELDMNLSGKSSVKLEAGVQSTSGASSASVAGSPQSNVRKAIPLMDPKSPRLRLSRPGSTAVRVIPPLRGLERVFCCSWCQTNLFNLASVIRTDLDVLPLTDVLNLALGKMSHNLGIAQTDSTHYHDNGDNGERNSSSCLVSAPSPRSMISTQRTYPDDSKEASQHPTLYRSHPQTSRAGGAKSFEFDVPLLRTSSCGENSDMKRTADDVKRKLEKPDFKSVSTEHEELSWSNCIRGESPMEVTDFKDDGRQVDVYGRRQSGKHLDVDSKLANDGQYDNECHRPRGDSSSSISPKYSVRSEHSLTPHLHPPVHPNIHGVSSQLSPSESPRIPFPPRGTRKSYVYPSPRNRPPSAEKRRWLERVHLLNSSAPDDRMEHADHLRGHEKVAKMSHDDDEAIKLGFGQDKYIYLEFLDWMGEELLSPDIDSGELKCGHCSRVIGAWTWNPSSRHTMGGRLQAPIIRVHKNVVNEVDIPFDPTPRGTPRVEDHMEE
eukprot:CAMPEP_0185029152 /NCGR_PEP_ID=MMETSP1103-20130426/15290_1 /TAXON_ID=36769 /ORGANISM="Paraphysomonas bandaiensis, Strain Caron Lab Isolate" /LENGTH=716 /DNA_ID=CAMNT_0027563795 /DNA_START=211 /DNA_END=2361 /DNA_ORIENTATION=+